LANLAVTAVDPPMMGAASGVFNTTRQVGGVLGSAAIGVLLQARLTVSMHAAAVTAAAGLPVGLRSQFVDSMSKVTTSAGGAGGCALPGGICATTFQHGFTDATRTTLILPVAVLILGALACIVIARRQAKPAYGTPSQAPEAMAESV